MLFLTSLINILSGSSWIQHPFLGTLLIIDGGIYNLISYAFNLFLLICQLDFSSLFGIVSPLVDRLKALVMVLVVFKLATSFIGWLINPENAPKEGSKLLINVFITAMFLIGYNFVFDVLNEVGMLLTGVPEGRDFTVLKQIADISTGGNRDEGLIIRFIFGTSEDLDEKLTDLGDFMALKTVTIFVQDINNPQESPYVVDTLCDGDICDFSKLIDLNGEIDKKIKYNWGISTIVGIYLIYSIVKVSIAIAVRMFKLIVLQILAPIAIITIIDGGIKSNVFQNFIKKYISTYLEAFVRILTMFIVTVFISKFFINKELFFGDFASSTSGSTDAQQFWIVIILIVAAFQAVNIIPKLIDEVLGTHLDSGGKKTSLAQYAAGLVGGALGFAGGVGSAFAAQGWSALKGGALVNGISGAAKGFSSTSKGNNVADFFKNTSENKKASRERALNIARMGGAGAYLGHGIENAIGIPQRQAAQSQRWADTSKAFDNMMAARSEFIKDLKYKVKDANGNVQEVKFGDSADSFASAMLEYDTDYINAQADYESAVKTGNAVAIASAKAKLIAARDTAMDTYKEVYNERLFASDVDKDARVAETTTIYNRRALSGQKTDDLANHTATSDVGKTIKKTKQDLASKQREIDNKGARQRDQRTGQF